MPHVASLADEPGTAKPALSRSEDTNQMTSNTAKYNTGDTVALGDNFPEFQRHWPAAIIHAMDHVSEFDGTPMYMVKFFHIQNYGCGGDGTLFVSEANLLPLPLVGELPKRPFGSYGDFWQA